MNLHIVIHHSLSVEFTHMENIPFPAQKINRWRKKTVSFFGSITASIGAVPPSMEAAYAPVEITHKMIENIPTAIEMAPTSIEMIHTVIKMVDTPMEIIAALIEMVHTLIEMVPTTIEMIHTAIKMADTQIEIIAALIEMVHTLIEMIPTAVEMVDILMEIIPLSTELISINSESNWINQITIKTKKGVETMYYVADSFEERLVSAKLALTNALVDAYILAQLSLLGLDETRLNEGMVLYQNAEQLYQKQKREYGEQYEATKGVEVLWQEARKLVNMYATVAKLMLDDSPSLRNMLGLNDSRKFSLPEWITWAKVFCVNAVQSEEVLEKFASFSVTEEKLQAALQVVEQLEAANAKQEFEKGDAQQATRDRDDAFVELDKFMYMFNKIARAVLVDKSEYLEKLGILKRSVSIPKEKSTEGEVPTTPPPAEPVVSDHRDTGANQAVGQ